MPHARQLPTGFKSSTTVGAGTEALGMASPVDFENRIGLTTNRKEIAASPLGSSTTCPQIAGNPRLSRALSLLAHFFPFQQRCYDGIPMPIIGLYDSGLVVPLRRFASSLARSAVIFTASGGISDPDAVPKLKQLPYPLNIRISHHDTDKVFVHGFMMDKP